MIDMNRLRGLTAELGFMPATIDEADIEHHRQHDKNADYWLARRHRFDHLRREHERRRQRQNPAAD
ncbi:MAG TPA: hypothetical protein VN959_10720 [Mycobacterium sp.]|nr:hypothetical protein [Mycobacterium sp.]